MFRSLLELFRYRELIQRLVALDLKVRYRGSFFGFLWTLLNPLLLTLVLWAVFSRFGRIQEENYALFLLSGLMAWIFFQQSVDRSMSSVIKNRSLIRKIYVPKLVFPLSVVASNLVNLFFFLVAYSIIALFTPVGLHLTLGALPLALLMLLVVTTGASLLMATANVFFRDFSHLTTVLLRAMFYLTPIIYRAELLGKRFSEVLKINPIYYPVVACRSVLYDGVMPPLEIWVTGFGIGAIMLLVGGAIFLRYQDRFVYYA